MKFFQTSLALLALFALMLPCAHADEHHHDELMGIELCASDHAECHSCSDEPCSDTPAVASTVSVSEIPIPQFQVLCELKPEPVVFAVSPRPSGELQLLQTVQLLI